MTWQERATASTYVSLGVEWNESNGATQFTIAPTIHRWDAYTTDNSGSSLSETLYPDANNGMGTGSWSGYSYPYGSGWRRVDSFATRTYTKGHSAFTITLRLYTDASYGTWHDGYFDTIGELNRTFNMTVPALASYTVSYNANGGSGAPAAQTKWYGETLKLSTTVPTRSGYIFKGWATSSSGSVAYAAGANYTNNAAVTLYAVWQLNTYTVAYNANGGTGAPASQAKTKGVNLTLSSTRPTRTGYTFVKWTTAANGTGTSYNPGGTYSTDANVTLYAQWKIITYTITYNANTGEGAPPAQTKNYGATITLSSVQPTKTGHSFSKWTTAAGGGGTSYNAGASYSGNANLVLYAQYIPDTYPVTYNANTGTNPPTAQTKTYGVNLTLSTAKPMRANSQFKGWATAIDSTTVVYSPGDTYTDNGPIDLFAVWAPIPQITNLTAVRVDENNEFDDVGTYCAIVVDWSVEELGAVSSGDLVVDAGPYTVSEYREGSVITGTGGRAQALVSGFDTDTQYPIIATVTAGDISTIRTVILTKAMFTMDFRAGGHAAGIGVAAPQSGLEVGWDTTFDYSVDVTGQARAEAYNVGHYDDTGKVSQVQADEYGATYLFGAQNYGAGDSTDTRVQFSVDPRNTAPAWRRYDGTAWSAWASLLLTTGGTLTGPLTIQGKSPVLKDNTIASGSWTGVAKDRKALVSGLKDTANGYCSTVGVDTSGGGMWNIGNYNDERLAFAYTPAANIASGTNYFTDNVYLPSGTGGGEIALTKNFVPRVPASTELPQSTATSNVFPIVLGNTFGNNGQISYMSTANFRTAIACNNAANLTTGTVPQARLTNVGWTYLKGTATTDHVRWCKIAGLVVVNVTLGSGAGLTAGTNVSFGTITSGNRPSYEVDAAIYTGGTSGASNAVVWVGTNGAVYMKSVHYTAVSAYGCLVYAVI